MTLAMFGGEPAVKTPLQRFNTIGETERAAVNEAVGRPLSGFLGGVPRGGPMVQRLEELWAQKFGVRYAIACNSATSGLMAAASCASPKVKTFEVSSFTMSATAAAPALLGLAPRFQDVHPATFNMNLRPEKRLQMVVVTNLFGQPADLHAIRALCDKAGALMIEDNAQSPLAREGGRYAGTIGHIGVFSLNIHKHIQCGEGGVVVTNDRLFADRIRGFINHGEMASQGLGLNLRMTEVTAAIAIAQLGKIDAIVDGRIFQGIKVRMAIGGVPWMKTVPVSVTQENKNVFYTVPFLYDEKELGIPRETMVSAMRAEGVPLSTGYVKPLYHLPAFQKCGGYTPVAEELHEKTLVYFENCSWSVTDEQIEQMMDACTKIDNSRQKLRGAA